MTFLGSYGPAVIEYCQKGDSIAKTSGDDTLSLYRRDEQGDWELVLVVESTGHLREISE